MARIGLFLLGLLLLACDEPNASADGFQLDIAGVELRDRAKILAAQDLMAGESGYITTNAENFCRSSDSRAQLLGRTLLIEPSDYGDCWDTMVESDGSVRLDYQVGTQQSNAHSDLVRAVMRISYADPCETAMERIRVEDSLLLRISSINGATKISELAEQVAGISSRLRWR